MKNNLQLIKKAKFYHLPLHYFMQRVVSSAAVLLLCRFLSTIAWNINSNTSQTSSSISEVSATEESNIASSPVAESEENIPEPTAQTLLKQNAGSLYRIAKSYEYVYELINSSEQTEIAVATGSSKTREATSNIDSNITENATTDVSFNSDTAATKQKNSFSRYSSTNLHTEGVDESDKVKTDGRYIYIVTNSKILITDTKDRHLTSIGSISPTLEASDSILEFYIDQNKLLLLIQHYDNSIESTNFGDNNDTTFIKDSNDPALNTVDVSCSKYTIDKKCQTILYIYNIENPATPVLEGKITQDGIYRTSHKINNM